MSLNYIKITDKEDKLRNLLDKGNYPFVIKTVEQQKTGSGKNNMLRLELTIATDIGREMVVRDWVMLDLENWTWKLRHLAVSVDLVDEYESGNLDSKDLVGKKGVAKITIGKFEKEGEEVAVNRVVDYLKPDGNLSVLDIKKALPKENQEFDDAIPF
jgi:hypothetical protein